MRVLKKKINSVNKFYEATGRFQHFSRDMTILKLCEMVTQEGGDIKVFITKKRRIC